MGFLLDFQKSYQETRAMDMKFNQDVDVFRWKGETMIMFSSVSHLSLDTE